MTHTEPANPKKRSDEEIRADLDAWENAEPAWNIDNRVYLDKLSDRLVDDVAPLLAALAAARSDADQLRTENERLRQDIDDERVAHDIDLAAEVEALESIGAELAAARVEVDTLRAKIGRATAAGIGAARIGKEIAIRHEYDAWLSELRDIEKQLTTLAGAVPGSPATPTFDQLLRDPATLEWLREHGSAEVRRDIAVVEQRGVWLNADGTTSPIASATASVPGSPETRQEEQR